MELRYSIITVTRIRVVKPRDRISILAEAEMFLWLHSAQPSLGLVLQNVHRSHSIRW